MKTDKLRNGSLYVNEETGAVERVLGKINGQRVWTSVHERSPQPTRTNRLRIADKKEVAEYLAASEVPEL